MGTAEWPEAACFFRQPVEWSRLLDLARHERLTPLLHHLITRTPSACEAPAEFRDAIGRDYLANAGRSLLRSVGLGEILAVCRRAGIEPLVLKGIALAEPVYGNPALRPMDDIDILVRRRDVPPVRAALADLGYEAPSFEDDLRRRAATVFFPPRTGSTRPLLDLHWDLVDDRYGPGAFRWAEGVWERARQASLGGVSVRALSPTDCLIHACVHLAVHHGLRGLLWSCDLAMMARAWREEIEWESLVDRVVEARLTGMVYAALRCAEAMVGLEVPEWVLARLSPRSLRGRAIERWLLPPLAALRSIPSQEYVVPLLLMDRGRDVAGVILGRLLSGISGHPRRASRRSAPSPPSAAFF